MKKRTLNSASPMQVSSSGQTLQVTAQYPFLNDIRCEDNSIRVEDRNSSAPPYINLTITITVDATVSSVFEFTNMTDGVHKLGLKQNVAKGLLQILSSGLSVLPSPSGQAVLVQGATGGMKWLPVSGSNAVLGVDASGNWTWFTVNDCQNSCS